MALDLAGLLASLYATLALSRLGCSRLACSRLGVQFQSKLHPPPKLGSLRFLAPLAGWPDPPKLVTLRFLARPDSPP